MSWWPLIRILPKKTNFTYVKFAGFAAFLSIAAVTGSLASMFTGGFRENPIAIYQQAEGAPFARIGAVMERGFQSRHRFSRRHLDPGRSARADRQSAHCARWARVRKRAMSRCRGDLPARERAALLRHPQFRAGRQRLGNGGAHPRGPGRRRDRARASPMSPRSAAKFRKNCSRAVCGRCSGPSC